MATKTKRQLELELAKTQKSLKGALSQIEEMRGDFKQKITATIVKEDAPTPPPQQPTLSGIGIEYEQNISYFGAQLQRFYNMVSAIKVVDLEEPIKSERSCADVVSRLSLLNEDFYRKIATMEDINNHLESIL